MGKINVDYHRIFGFDLKASYGDSVLAVLNCESVEPIKLNQCPH